MTDTASPLAWIDTDQAKHTWRQFGVKSSELLIVPSSVGSLP
jgi:hypothetical protein